MFDSKWLFCLVKREDSWRFWRSGSRGVFVWNKKVKRGLVGKNEVKWGNSARLYAKITQIHNYLLKST